MCGTLTDQGSEFSDQLSVIVVGLDDLSIAAGQRRSTLYQVRTQCACVATSDWGEEGREEGRGREGPWARKIWSASKSRSIMASLATLMKVSPMIFLFSSGLTTVCSGMVT